MLGLLLNIVYLLLILFISPMLLYKSWRDGKYRAGWKQKLWGELPRRNEHCQQRVWFHAVSVGEVLQLQQVVRELRRQSSDVELLISTSTKTGYQVACEKFSDCDVSYFPLDFTWSVKNALHRVQPDLIVLVELELWPNFLRCATARTIPVMLINGRLSERSYQGYRKLRPLFSSLLNKLHAVAVQSHDYEQRFLSLGCHTERVTVTGSIKFDGAETNRARPAVDELRTFFQIAPDEIVLIAGSTQHPEEEMVLKAFEHVQSDHKNARLIIAPRHPERGVAVAQMIEKAGYPVIRRSRSDGSQQQAHAPVGLLDTVGELCDCWGLAEIAFVGGSFGDRGGQNMLEPAAYGAAVCFGPNTRNFKQIVEQLHAAEAARTVSSQAELCQFFEWALSNLTAADEMGQRAQHLVVQQQGATKRTVSLIVSALSENCPQLEPREAA